MDTRPRPGKSHIPALDGVRGLAVLAILIGHAWINPFPGSFLGNTLTAFIRPTWIGVDLFFVLSGFLITGILYDSIPARNYFRVFYYRRFLRIFPLYYGVLLVLLGLTYPLHIAWHNRQWIFLLYLQNTGIVHDIFTRPFSPWISLSHFWSLAVEEQFYMVWPLLIFLIKDIRKLIFITLGLSVCALLLRIVLTLHHVEPLTIYFSTFTRADSLMIGSLVALLMRSSDRIRSAAFRFALPILLVSLLPLIAMAWHGRAFNLNAASIQTFGYTFLGIVFACVIILALKGGPVQSFTSNSLLRWFGKYSYGIYVFHPILLAAGAHGWPLLLAKAGYSLSIGPPARAAFAAVDVVLSVALAYASYHLYEKRFLSLKDRMKYRFSTKEEFSSPLVLVPAGTTE